MTKYPKPKTIWVVFWEGWPLKIYKEKVVKNRHSNSQSVGCYYLRPGNEVARALNLINNMVIWTPSEVAKRLKRFNFRVRWSQKLGRFV